jgi:hypothetical protein
MDHSSEEQPEVEILAVAGAAVSNAAAKEGTKGEELFIWTPQELCCRFCGRATVYLDCG